MKLNLEIAFKIPGYTNAYDLVDLHVLAMQVPKGGKAVEIGCWKGRSSYAIWSGLDSDDFTVVDTFGGTPGEEEFFKDAGETACLEFSNNMLDAFHRVPNICLNDSVQAAKLFPDRCVDLLFIDGDHSTERVIRDIRAWLPKMKVNSIMAGHDYDRETVREGVKRCFRSPGMITPAGTIWIQHITGEENGNLRTCV